MNYDNVDIPARYAAGRNYAPHVLRMWMDIVSQHVRPHQIARILDLGCGTGRYSSALADHFDADVEAIDPSEKMLQQASRKPHVRVRFRRARGEAVPVADQSVDLVFMSMVFHHFDSPGRVAEECRRVLRAGGSVCVRTGTVEQIPRYPYVPFFADTESILETDLPARAFVESVFREAALPLVHHELVIQESATSLEAYATRLSQRADSILAQLSDDDFLAGLTSLRKYARSQPDAGPVTQPIDFFVFRPQLIQRSGTVPSSDV